MTDLIQLLSHPAVAVALILLAGIAVPGIISIVYDEITTRKRERLEREVLRDFDVAVSELQDTAIDDPTLAASTEQLSDFEKARAMDEGVLIAGKYAFRHRHSVIVSDRDLVSLHTFKPRPLEAFIDETKNFILKGRARSQPQSSAFVTIGDVYAFMHGVMSAGMMDEASAKTIKAAIEHLRSSRGQERQRATHPEHATTQG
jgi:hypothetical protein